MRFWKLRFTSLKHAMRLTGMLIFRAAEVSDSKQQLLQQLPAPPPQLPFKRPPIPGTLGVQRVAPMYKGELHKFVLLLRV